MLEVLFGYRGEGFQIRFDVRKGCISLEIRNYGFDNRIKQTNKQIIIVLFRGMRIRNNSPK